MGHPKIQLKFDEKLDQEIAWEFYSKPEFGGTNFWENGALRHHPELKELEKSSDPKSFLKKYISNFYKTKAQELNKLSKKTSEYVEQTQNNYFKIVDKIFNNYPWPQKIVTGVFSIFDFCPRFLDWGGFQIFLYDKKKMQLFTISHEMLHFIFYSYSVKRFPKQLTNLDTETGKFWDLAEIFNAVIQDTEDFINLHGPIINIGYPDHKNFITKGKNLWKEKQDIDEWIKKMLKILP